MEYHYVALEKLFSSLAVDMSEENMRKQLLTLTSDEVRKLKDEYLQQDPNLIQILIDPQDLRDQQEIYLLKLLSVYFDRLRR